MKMFYEKDTNPSLIKDKKIAILGYGSYEFIRCGSLGRRSDGIDTR